MKLTKIFGTILAIFLIAGAAISFGKIVQPKVTVQILTPTASQHTTSPAFVISGSAHANTAIAGVSYQLDAGGWTPALLFNSGKSWDAVVMLTPGTNTLRVYARDTAGNVSSTNSVRFFYDIALKSLIGLTAVVTNDTTAFILSFSTNTFSMSSGEIFDDNGVGSYTYSKLNSSVGKVTLAFKAPPTLANGKSVFNLQFTTNNSGWFTNGSDTDFFTFVNVPALAPTNPLDTVVLDDNTGGETIFVFPPPSTIFDNGHLFNVKNPFPIPLDTPYPGNIGDRVSVDLAHYGFSLNRWNFINSVKDSGTVTAFGTNSGGTNTVTVLFDIAPFISSKDAFIPLAGGLVNVLTFFYTNTVDGTVTPGGSFTYKNYSPIGALLTTDAASSTNYYILTFTNNDVGNYIGESVDSSGSTNGSFGAFNLTSSFNGGGGGSGGNLMPASVSGGTLVTTNNDFFEKVQFINAVSFQETNSVNPTNSTGNYTYTSNSLNNATVGLTFLDGPTLNFSNAINMIFMTTNSGTFHTDIFDDSGNPFTNYDGSFKLR